MDQVITIPGIGNVSTSSGMIPLKTCSDGIFVAGEGGVVSVTATGDGKVEFIAFDNRSIAYIKSSMGYPAYYPVHSVKLERPIKAVLMDLDGTSVRSEEFWIWIIKETCTSLLNDSKFELTEEDMPYVSGHSVSEHLKYCIEKYCPTKTVEEARGYYFEHTHREMRAIMEGIGKENAFTPSKGLKAFLLELKKLDIKIGLVTSGLYEKAWPEIVSAFKTLDMGDPKNFYDSSISAGFPLRIGEVGTLGELSPKPHPWLYAEVSRVGLGFEFEDRKHILGIEDSGAGVCSIKLAGFTTIGVGGGNIISSGTRELCDYYFDSFEEILRVIKGE